MSQAPVQSDRYLQGWVYAPVVDGTDHLREIQQTLLGRLDTDQYECPDEFHLTLFPCVQVPQTHFDVIDDALAAINLTDVVSATGLRLFPSPDTPAVVLVDVAAPITPARNALRDIIHQTGGKIPERPDPPHITLFKQNTGTRPSHSIDVTKADIQELKNFRGAVEAFPIRLGEPKIIA